MNKRDLNKLARATISSKGQLGEGISYIPEMQRRHRALNNFTKQGGALCEDACALAPLIIENAAQIKSDSWAPVMVAVGFAKTALNNAAGNPDITNEDVIKGYEDTLEAIAEHNDKLCSARGTGQIVKRNYDAMFNEYKEIIENPEVGRAKINPITPQVWAAKPPVPVNK